MDLNVSHFLDSVQLGKHGVDGCIIIGENISGILGVKDPEVNSRGAPKMLRKLNSDLRPSIYQRICRLYIGRLKHIRENSIYVGTFN